MGGPARRDGALHVVLLAGGSGTRFWPRSRKDCPKQFLALAGRRPLIVDTWRRARRLAPAERIWVVAPAALQRGIREALPELHRDRIVVEPSPRDTAPAIALACTRVARRDPSAVTAVFPTDHVIEDVRAFRDAVRLAARTARDGGLVCLGVRPTRPATGFGYLECAPSESGTAAMRVKKFVEKPDRVRAERYVRSGRFLWNAGMFVWRADRFLGEVRRVAPAIDRAVNAFADGDPGAWSRATRKSVDYAVMEQAEDVRAVRLDAGWDDVGSWDAAARLRENAGRDGGGEQILVSSPGTVVFGGERLVAVVDVPNVAVVDTPDAVLVVSRDSAERVREVTDRLRRKRWVRWL